MMLSSFDDLLRAARSQPGAQRLLFVFTVAGIDSDATSAQRERHQAGEGGTLTPLMCVDKAADELASFDALVQESRQFHPAWDIVFVAALSGRGQHGPSEAEAQAPLQGMVEAIKSGRIGGFAAFDAAGVPVVFG